MIIGVPKEIKTNENRVALVPAGAEAFATRGHEVYIEQGAGLGSGFPDDTYVAAGAKILPTADAVWAKAEMIMKVKEPIAVEWPRMRAGQVIYTYFHFAAAEELTKAVINSKAIIGGGVVGINAAKMAAGLGARVTILDISLERLRYLDDVLPANVTTLYSNRHNILDAIRRADLVVGAVLLPGAKAPHLVKREDLKVMKPGSVIVDVAVDQGGCVETIKPTTHENPTYFVDGILHYAVANMPGGVPRTSTLALTNATLSYGLRLARDGWKKASKDDPALKLGLNVVEGKVVYPGVAEAFGLPLVQVDSLL
jgi:alanine dehydrogenase